MALYQQGLNITSIYNDSTEDGGNKPASKHALGEKRISTGEEVEASAMEDEGGSRLMTTDHT